MKLAALDQLQELLNQDDTFKRYREAGEKLHQNPEILAKYDAFLTLQKEVVNLEHYQKKQAFQEKQDQLEALQDELFDHPLFSEYLQLQIELEELFQVLAASIELQVNEGLGMGASRLPLI